MHAKTRRASTPFNPKTLNDGKGRTRRAASASKSDASVSAVRSTTSPASPRTTAAACAAPAARALQQTKRRFQIQALPSSTVPGDRGCVAAQEGEGAEGTHADTLKETLKDTLKA